MCLFIYLLFIIYSFIHYCIYVFMYLFIYKENVANVVPLWLVPFIRCYPRWLRPNIPCGAPLCTVCMVSLNDVQRPIYSPTFGAVCAGANPACALAVEDPGLRGVVTPDNGPQCLVIIVLYPAMFLRLQISTPNSCINKSQTSIWRSL